MGNIQNTEFGVWGFALVSRYKGKVWDLQATLGLFGTIPDLIPNLGPLYEHCIVYLFGRGVKVVRL